MKSIFDFQIPKIHSTKTVRENVKDDSGVVSAGNRDFSGLH
jgi:hypothetical protein